MFEFQGTYVVQDNQFRLLLPVSDGGQFADKAPRYMHFSCGMIRGALANLGIASAVTAEMGTMPVVKFNIVVQPPA